MTFNEQGQQQKSWWSRDRQKDAQDRLDEISRINDPGTIADEVLAGSRWILVLLLLPYTAFLGFFSWFKIIGHSFPEPVAIALAAAVAIAVEWGKFRASSWALKIGFFHGIRYIGHSVANTVLFVGVLVTATITFGMSVYNSTHGGEHLAKMLSHERNDSAFVPETSAIDAQIAATQATITNAPLVRQKKKLVYQDAATVRSAQESLTKLQDQRQQAIDQQRADWEAARDRTSAQSSMTGSWMLAGGGWVEGLQVVLIVVIGACLKVLDTRDKARRAGSPTPSATNQRMYGNGQPAPNGQPSNYQNATTNNPIGFFQRHNDPYQPQNAVAAVPQMPQPQQQAAQAPISKEATDWVRARLRDLQRELPNLDNPDAAIETVASRIAEKLRIALDGVGVLPLRSVDTELVSRFISYLNHRLLPAIDRHNVQGPHRQLIDDLGRRVAHLAREEGARA